jgi:LysR family transcriptional regulator, hydrogen peroxide-inducible genes activator
MITLKQLRYALAVEQTLHFKKASEQCNVSPSALSTALHELESQLKVQLFERDNKQVLLTTKGKDILHRARQILLQVDDLEQFAKNQNEALSGELSIGLIPTIAPFLLPHILPALQTSYPNLSLTLVEEQSHVLVEKVRFGELDAAILALPYPCEGLLSFPFHAEDFYWIAHRDNELAHLHEISSDKLELSKLMLLKEGHCLKDHILEACHLQKQSAEHGFSATSLNTLVQMVAGGLGTTLVPEMALEQLHRQNPELAAVHLNEPSPHRTIAFIVRPGYTRLNSIEALSSLCREVVKK